ncbi:hypothetical protein [Methylocystis echinoides]|uniref:hypothetical protein n=1 Tax=Methylocystis echinoides TaxID=29468 RepID=UPI00344688C9
MAMKNLPDFNEATGPHSARYFKAAALSKRMQEQRNKLFEEGQAIRRENPGTFSQMNYEYATVRPREINAAEALVAEFVRPEGEVAQPASVNSEALARGREIGTSTQQLDDALHQLGEKMLELHVRSCKEFVLLPEVQSAYRPIGERISVAILELASAVDEHDAFVEALSKRGVRHFSWLGPIERPSWNTIRRMLRSAVEAGHITKDQLDKWNDKQ